jgi:hypothetical protein
MRILRILSLGALVTMPLPIEMAGAGASKPVATVYWLQGAATLATPNASRPLRSFDRLPTGIVLEVAPNSRLTLAFENGIRYELGGGSRVTLGPKGLTSRKGLVRELPPIPAFPLLAPIAKDDHPGFRPGAVTLRGERITGLYPHHGATVLTEEAVLRFRPVTGAREYRIEVQDEEGQIVFQTDVASPPVSLPAGILHTDHRYWWTVRTVDRPGAVARGEAELVTLSEDAARMREEARRILEVEGSESLPLLVEIDRSLGLLFEAREDLHTALDREGADPALLKALTEVERQLENDDDQH